MAHLTINVPEEHVDALRRELLRAHAARVAALRQALDEYAGSRERLDDLQGALVELADLHHALAQLGWKPGPPGAVTLTAHPEVIADAVAAAGLPEPAAGSDGGERS